jgi:ABC-type phosphate transport system substrate-binding protein
MKPFTKTVVTLLMLSLGLCAFAEVSVIVHPSNNNSFDKNAIKRIFLGKSRAFPSGGEAIPGAFKDGTPESNEFTSAVLSKTPKQLKAYWAKMIFTGKGTPPQAMESNQSILDVVSSNPSSIGFVLSGSESGSVKVVGKF